MSIRDTLRNSPVVGIAVAVVLIIVALTILMRSGPDAQQVGQWYYDLSAGELVTGGAEPPSPSAVSARVFGCNQCGDDAFVGYLEKPNPDPPPVPEGQPNNPMRNVLVAAVPEVDAEVAWIVGSEPAARNITSYPAQKCGQRFRECLP